MAGAVVLVAFGFAMAQERRDAQDPAKSKPATTQPGRDLGRGQGGDAQLVAWLAADNETEIALSKFATERAQNGEVKKFAQKMADAHSQFLQKLRGIAPIAATEPGSREPDRRATTQTDDPKRTQPKTETAQTKPADETTVRRSYLDAGAVDLVRIKQEIAKECLATAKKELGEKSGAEFDMCYMGFQIGAHFAMVDTLKVMKNYASPELRRLVEDAHKTANEHLAQAKEIAKQLEKDSKK
jgi:predicted outer membrane protein